MPVSAAPTSVPSERVLGGVGGGELEGVDPVGEPGDLGQRCCELGVGHRPEAGFAEVVEIGVGTRDDGCDRVGLAFVEYRCHTGNSGTRHRHVLAENGVISGAVEKHFKKVSTSSTAGGGQDALLNHRLSVGRESAATPRRTSPCCCVFRSHRHRSLALAARPPGGRTPSSTIEVGGLGRPSGAPAPEDSGETRSHPLHAGRGITLRTLQLAPESRRARWVAVEPLHLHLERDARVIRVVDHVSNVAATPAFRVRRRDLPAARPRGTPTGRATWAASCGAPTRSVRAPGPPAPRHSRRGVPRGG